MNKTKDVLKLLGLFITPIFILLTVLIKLKIAPFGEESIWYIDLPAQMTMFYHHLYDVFQGDSSAIYTWNYGMGTSFWATICYYLSSPLSILILLFPESYMPYSILMIWLAKIGLSSVTMSYLLKKHFTKQGFIIFIFSISYALISFSITYYFLPMWLDAIYLLPLIIAGVHDLLKSEKHSLFLISLTILFFANFYIAYMVGIFVFLYFVAECIVHQFNKKELINRVVLFFKSVFFAFLFTSFITIPTYLELRSNKYTSEAIELTTYLLNPLELYSYFFNGTTPIQNISIYAGLVVLLLVPLYFFNDKYHVRERVVYGLLVAFVLFSMTSTLLNMAWHVFEMPNGAYYRYAFIVSFLMIIFSVKALTKLEFSTIKPLMIVLIFNIVILSLANKLFNQTVFNLDLINRNIVLLALFTVILVILMNKKMSSKVHTLAKIGLCLLIFIDLGLNIQAVLVNYMKVSRPYNWYNTHNPSYSNAIDRLHEMDDSFFRTKVEPSLSQSKNESLRYKYKGMSIYTSTGQAEHNLFLNQLGYPANTRAAGMENGIFLSDTLLGFKYVVTTQELDDRIYTKMFEEEEINVYKINTNLPLGYMVNEGFMTHIGETDLFSIQNSLINGHNSDAFYYEQQDPQLTLNGLVSQLDAEGNSLLQRQTATSTPSIEANISINETRELYMKVDSETYKNVEDKIEIFINNTPIVALKTEISNLLHLGTYQDEKLTINIKLKDSLQSLQTPVFYTLNHSMLEKQINELKGESLVIKDYSDTNVRGELTVNQDEEMLFMSIPYDDNWKVTVDGVTTEYTKIGNFIGIPLEKGTHEIHLEYIPRILYICMGVSAVSLLGYLVLVFGGRKKDRKRSGA
ncbi:YfhO family protein [Litchfieldia salsa]|uniref:Uncharacterized membrane protein YfhO n=1 Tax=Litchfieldia salsa TaxID=930152 RepID=A0A1H0PM28_9BACI|nr:YfhO family protein [Litchfieldia salsa]SDP05646.1 Uncharacterized membrane protein YfhO [Litchfieldia salsa]